MATLRCVAILYWCKSMWFAGRMVVKRRMIHIKPIVKASFQHARTWGDPTITVKRTGNNDKTYLIGSKTTSPFYRKNSLDLRNLPRRNAFSSSFLTTRLTENMRTTFHQLTLDEVMNTILSLLLPSFSASDFL